MSSSRGSVGFAGLWLHGCQLWLIQVSIFTYIPFDEKLSAAAVTVVGCMGYSAAAAAAELFTRYHQHKGTRQDSLRCMRQQLVFVHIIS